MIIGVDPGESTGAFIIDLYPSLVDPPYVIEATNRYQGPPGVVLERLETELEAARRALVVTIVAVERFTSLPSAGRMTHQPVPQQVVGQLEVLAERYGAEFILQAPGDAKKFCSNDQLRRYNFWTTPKMVDQPDANDVNDAARHAVLALAKRRTTAYEVLLKLGIPTQRS